MIIVNVFFACVMLVLLPVVMGRVVASYAKMHEELNITSIIFWYVMGNVTLWAIFQLIAVPMILAKLKFMVAVITWICLVVLILVFSFFMWKKRDKHFLVRIPKADEKEKKNIWEIIGAILAAVFAIGLVFVQCYIYVTMMHIDQDDSRFVVNALEAYDNNVMLLINPATGEYVGTWIGELAKDVSSPWMIYVALVAKVCSIHPTILAHTILPPFLLLMAYGAFWLIGDNVFKGNKTASTLVVGFAALINMYFTDTTHTQSFVTLVRIWQGKAVVAGVMIPFMLYLLMLLCDEDENRRIYGILTIAAMGMSLLSGVGIFFSGIMIGTYGVYYNLVNKRWKSILFVLVACIPTVVYGLTYALVK